MLLLLDLVVNNGLLLTDTGVMSTYFRIEGKVDELIDLLT